MNLNLLLLTTIPSLVFAIAGYLRDGRANRDRAFFGDLDSPVLEAAIREDRAAARQRSSFALVWLVPAAVLLSIYGVGDIVAMLVMGLPFAIYILVPVTRRMSRFLRNHPDLPSELRWLMSSRAWTTAIPINSAALGLLAIFFLRPIEPSSPAFIQVATVLCSVAVLGAGFPPPLPQKHRLSQEQAEAELAKQAARTRS